MDIRIEDCAPLFWTDELLVLGKPDGSIVTFQTSRLLIEAIISTCEREALKADGPVTFVPLPEDAPPAAFVQNPTDHPGQEAVSLGVWNIHGHKLVMGYGFRSRTWVVADD